MTDEDGIDGENARAAPLFILSFRQLDELVPLAAGAGWAVTAERDGANAAARFAASGASVAVVDARGALEDGLAAVAALSGSAGAVLALVSRGDATALGRVYAAGATHFLASPAGEGEFVHALRFAARTAPPRGRRRDDSEPASRMHGLDGARRWAAGRLAEGQPVAAVRASLARFDIVNAAHGRAAGDAILAEAAARLTDVAADLWGPDGLAARAAGAEFALVGDGAKAGAGRVAEEAARALAAPFGRVALGCRVGSADSMPEEDAAAVLRRAADAMRRAREGGWVRRAAEAEGAASPDVLAVDLHHAIARGEVTILFQPQAAVADGRVVGVEALARWEHPRLGPLGADALFAAAERAGLGVPLSDHIQELVLERAAAWPPALRCLRVSLNLTAADLDRPDFAPRFLERVAASGFPAAQLTAEVTETGLIADLPAAARLLATLREAGCRTAIDDFGTGYSSLAYLQALPLDYLKLDRALVQQDGERVVAAGVLAMARSLGLATIAEGVETEEQRRTLAAEGCDLYQGFLCAGALDEAALARLVEERDAA